MSPICSPRRQAIIYYEVNLSIHKNLASNRQRSRVHHHPTTPYILRSYDFRISQHRRKWLFYGHVVAHSAKRRETASTINCDRLSQVNTSNLIELDRTRQHFNGSLHTHHLHAHHPSVLHVLHGHHRPHVRPTKKENNRWIRAI